MASEKARQIAATAWCTEANKHKEMDVDLAEAFAEIVDKLCYKMNECKNYGIKCPYALPEDASISCAGTQQQCDRIRSLSFHYVDLEHDCLKLPEDIRRELVEGSWNLDEDPNACQCKDEDGNPLNRCDDCPR